MDKATRHDIDRVVAETLRDAGIVTPPVRIEPVLDHLSLHRDYYNLQDPAFLERAKYRVRVHGKKLVQLLRRIRLSAVLLYDEDRILVDSSLAPLRRDWPAFHEVTHRIIEWHRPSFCYGDTAQTLDPAWEEQLEAEANYGASALMFCGQLFASDARDTKPEWASVEQLKERYGRNFLPTLRRYVEHGPEWAMAMLVSTPSWKQKPEGQHDRWRHFVVSAQFAERFGNVQATQLLRAVDANVDPCFAGRAAAFALPLGDDNGQAHESQAETFNNTYDLLTFFVWRCERSAARIVMPRSVSLPSHKSGSAR